MADCVASAVPAMSSPLPPKILLPRRKSRQRVSGTVQTVRRTAEATVLPSALDFLLNQLPDVVLLADDWKCFSWANRAACRLLNAPRAALAGRPIGEFCGPGDRRKLARTWRKLMRVGHLSGEWRFCLPDGQVREIEFSAQANFFAGHHLAWCRDITPRKRAETQIGELTGQLERRVKRRTRQLERINQGLQSDIVRRELAEMTLRGIEQRLRGAVNASLDAFYLQECVRNARGRIVDFRYVDLNRRGAELVSLRRENVIGRTLRELFPESFRLGFFRKFVRVVESGQPLKEEFRVDAPNIKARWLHQQVVPSGDGIAITARDITERKQTEQTLQEFSRRILAAQEAERRRVARELHDGVSQILASVRFRLHALEARLAGNRPAQGETARARRLLEAARDQVKRISHGLRPSELDDLGLVPALRGLAAEFRTRTRMQVRLHCPRRGMLLSPVVEVVLYRLTQEALTNIERHSRARRVVLRLERAKAHVLLRIGDDGRGFVPQTRLRRSRISPGGQGLANMRERVLLVGGAFELNSAPGRGTEIAVRIPLRIAHDAVDHSDAQT